MTGCIMNLSLHNHHEHTHLSKLLFSVCIPVGSHSDTTSCSTLVRQSIPEFKHRNNQYPEATIKLVIRRHLKLKSTQINLAFIKFYFLFEVISDPHLRELINRFTDDVMMETIFIVKIL